MHINLIPAREIRLSCDSRWVNFLFTQYRSTVVHNRSLFSLVILIFSLALGIMSIAACIMTFIVMITVARFHSIAIDLLTKALDLFIVLAVLVHLVLELIALHR